MLFLSTPSARRATLQRLRRNDQAAHFYPRPPRGGRPFTAASLSEAITISIHALREEGDQRAVADVAVGSKISIHALREEGDFPNPLPQRRKENISIHALREEGDCQNAAPLSGQQHFYPRPPRGGRPPASCIGWRSWNFYPRPPRGGRQNPTSFCRRKFIISIHALREEGDADSLTDTLELVIFLSTPSARRATCRLLGQDLLIQISIHALREEGDLKHTLLRVQSIVFLSTPSARRATCASSLLVNLRIISIHALREEGDGL